MGALALNPSLSSFLLLRQAGAFEVTQAGHELMAKLPQLTKWT